MFVTEIAAVLATIFFVRDLVAGADGVAVGRPDRDLALVHGLFRQLRRRRWPKAAARRGPIRSARRRAETHGEASLEPATATELVRAGALRPGDVILVEAGDIVPADGEVVEGIASVDECAITGESAPVIRESGGDRSGVTGGTRVVSDWLRCA